MPILSTLPALISGGSFGAGTIGNIIEQKKRADYQNKLMSIINNPGKLAQMATATEKPLDNALVQGVTNNVQGQLAERGLSQAPGIFASTESQALAPYVQQNQQTAMQAILQALQLPGGTFGAPSNNSGALQMFLKALNPSTAASSNSNSGSGGFIDLSSFAPGPTAGVGEGFS